MCYIFQSSVGAKFFRGMDVQGKLLNEILKDVRSQEANLLLLQYRPLADQEGI